jgi:hypothetical protein
MGAELNPQLIAAAAEEVRRRALQEMSVRKQTPGFKKALKQAIACRGRTDTALLTAQQRVMDDASRLITMCCSRRAGKTSVLARIVTVSLLDSSFDEWTCFGARTLGIAKDLIWAELRAMNDRYELGWKINDSDLSIQTARGGRFRLFGVSDKKSLDKARGKKYRLVVLDEASTYEPFLRQLIQNDFDPGTKDINGRIILSGTPGYVKAGYWFESSQGLLKGWSNHYWTIRDNIYIADVEAKLAETREMFGYDENHPTYICEYLGIWPDVDTMRVFEYLPSRNDVQALPDDYSLTWRHVIGIDYGYVDACAWVVIAVNPYTDERYVVHEYEESGLIVDDAVAYTKQLVARFDTTYVVADPGGGGKGFYETFNAKHAREMGCTIRSADKQDMLGSIRLVNAELRTARLRFLESECAGLTGDLRRLLWKDERRDKIVEGASFPKHRADALRYALLETVAWRAKDKPPEVAPVALAEMRARADRAKRQQQKTSRGWFEGRR